MRFALSTMYFQRWEDQSDLGPFYEAGTGAGFDAFELGHVLSERAVGSAQGAAGPAQGAVGSARSTAVRIAAVHHPCPNPGGGPPATLASLPAEDCAVALDEIRRTLTTAARLGAPMVVLHLGEAEDDGANHLRRRRFELESRFLAGQRDSERYLEVLHALRATIREREARHLDRALPALVTLAGEAAESGLGIGLETGYYAQELPTPEGMRQLLAAVGAHNVGAWLDTGHVGAQTNLGLVDGFHQWFEAVGRRWCGVHLHDVVGLRDHLVPGTGQLDFAFILHRLRHLEWATCEVDWYFSPEELRQGLVHLRSCLAHRY